MWKQVTDRFPLYDDKINKQQINDYWTIKPYNLEIPSILGNCTLCFMKGKNAIMAILREHPELAEPWVNDELNTKHTYFKDVSMKQLLTISQNNLFSNHLSEIQPAFDCACTT